ncbi:hypothetical protein BC628DRAFT_275202 [Trametes gibbosa]|nr:hypothetical protein BC628DRAFT_275202 [Trametes gibbosa]
MVGPLEGTETACVHAVGRQYHDAAAYGHRRNHSSWWSDPPARVTATRFLCPNWINEYVSGRPLLQLRLCAGVDMFGTNSMTGTGSAQGIRTTG